MAEHYRVILQGFYDTTVRLQGVKRLQSDSGVCRALESDSRVCRTLESDSSVRRDYSQTPKCT